VVGQSKHTPILILHKPDFRVPTLTEAGYWLIIQIPLFLHIHPVPIITLILIPVPIITIILIPVPIITIILVPVPIITILIPVPIITNILIPVAFIINILILAPSARIRI
jgi:hypothetical protein